MGPARKKFNMAALQELCNDLERHVLSRGLSTELEMGPRRPGGEDNPRPNRYDMWSLLRWYGALCQFMVRDGGAQDEFEVSAAERAAIDALRSEPLPVKLMTGRLVMVYPKSFHALMNCAARDQMIIWVSERLHAVRSAGAKARAAEAELIERLANELAYQYALLAWTITTKGPEMPFDPMSERVNPPKWTLALDPMDYVSLCRAHSIVNGKRLILSEALMDPTTAADGRPARRPTWAVFFSDMSKKYKVPPARLMRDYALAELVASSMLESRPAPAAEESEDLEDAGGA